MLAKIHSLLERKPWIIPLGLYFCLVTIHLLINAQIQVPLVFPDEYGYLAQARFIASGIHFNLDTNPYYHFGYPLVLAPIFLFSLQATTTHYLALVLNAFLISSLFFSLYYILRYILGSKRNLSLILSFITCLYPAFYVNSFLVWSENLSIPLFAWWLVLFWRVLNKQTYLDYLFFAFVTAFLYATHLRFSLVVLATVIYLLVIALKKRKVRWQALSAAGLVILLTLATIKINTFLLSQGWTKALYYPENVLQLIAEHLWPLARLKTLLLIILGQFLYLLQATHGIFLISLIYITSELFQKTHFNFSRILNDRKQHWFFFLLLSVFSIFIFTIVAFFLTRDPAQFRADHIIYGRHNETFIGIFIALGLSLLFSQNKIKGKYLIYFVLLLLPIVFKLIDTDKILENSVSNYSTSALAPLVYITFNQLNVYFPSIISVLVFYLASHNRRFSFFIVGAIFAIYTQQRLISSYQHNFNIKNFIMTSINLESSLPPDTREISYDNFYFYDNKKKDFEWPKTINYIRFLRWRLNFLSLQYYNPQLKFYSYDSAQGEHPPTKYYISEKNFRPTNSQFDDLILAEDARGDIYLWQKATSTTP